MSSKNDFAAKIKKMQDAAIEKNTIREVIGDKEPRTERKALSVYVDNELWQWVRREAFNTEQSKSDIVAGILSEYAHAHPNTV